uniref:USP domain-containing protein n=1 Tax=Heliothis virescens TaxID=7102 RepID=A0A2A4IT13_HELVI
MRQHTDVKDAEFERHLAFTIAASVRQRQRRYKRCVSDARLQRLPRLSNGRWVTAAEDDEAHLRVSVPRQCTVCGSLARWECAACAGAALEAGALCDNCRRVAHATRPHHKATPLNVCEEFANILESCPVPRVYMELFAVLCIETSHYVAFVKAGVGHDAPWCFFDSMADRKGERNGYNIPEIVCTSELGAWLGEEGARAPTLPAHAKRLLSDAYMCFYRSPDVSMYR